MRILIVDNNIELCQVLEKYLNNQPDFTVAGIAYDGEEALVKIRDLEPDVVLLDITMPYLDGLGVLERLRALDLKKRPKMFVMTAFGSDGLLRRLTALGADYFLVKPFHLDVLVKRLRQFSEEWLIMGAQEAAFAANNSLTSDQRITKLLHNMGIPPHYKGFSYLKEAVLMCVDEGYLSGSLSKELYPALAKKYHTTVSGVEAAIRNAVVAAWENGNQEYIKELCSPHCIHRMPTNSLIIAKIAEKDQLLACSVV